MNRRRGSVGGSLTAIVVALALAVAGSAIAAQTLTRADARDKAQSHADRAHCPDPCLSTIARICDRVNDRPNKRRCSAKVRYAATSGRQRVCKGKVTVTRKPSRLVAKSSGWRCRNA